MASTSNLSEKLMDVHLGKSQSTSYAPSCPPAYTKDLNTSRTLEPEPTPSNPGYSPSAPLLEHLSPPTLTENTHTKSVHPEIPPPSYDSVCVTQPKYSPRQVRMVSANVAPPNDGWRRGGVTQSSSSADTDCCDYLLLACQICYCTIECCQCCLLCASLLASGN